jgi:LL-diaminopimelate aminotransferase
MKPVARRMAPLKENYFKELENEIYDLQESGSQVIRLDVGSPDLPPPAPVLEVLKKTAELPTSHGYQPHAPRAVRQAWADSYRKLHGVELESDKEVLPLLGSKEGIFNLTQALVDPGDIVLIPDPGYLTYTQAALFAGGVPFMLPLLPERDYLPDLKGIPPEVLGRAKILWMNYPNNPTASVANLEFFSEAVDFARQNDLLICHDAAYTQVTFDGWRAPSILEVEGAKDVAVEFNTLSKSHNMPGWRVGVLVGNQKIVKMVLHLKANVDSSHFYPILAAAVEALTGEQEWIVNRNEIYRQRRDTALQVLEEFGCKLPTPLGSLYLWCPVPGGWSSNEFVRAVLQATQVSVTPGTVFGSQGEGFYRVSLTAPVEIIEIAFRRIGIMLQSLERRPA